MVHVLLMAQTLEPPDSESRNTVCSSPGRKPGGRELPENRRMIALNFYKLRTTWRMPLAARGTLQTGTMLSEEGILKKSGLPLGLVVETERLFTTSYMAGFFSVTTDVQEETGRNMSRHVPRLGLLLELVNLDGTGQFRMPGQSSLIACRNPHAAKNNVELNRSRNRRRRSIARNLEVRYAKGDTGMNMDPLRGGKKAGRAGLAPRAGLTTGTEGSLVDTNGLSGLGQNLTH
ncbi:hypothetical protein BDP55DRAFT_631472 [Colletotrichum godetiae]|uniref:Uncharacterized protein n=1 Tax=Colletotrichum godetiae TaxID=1209918 RepID=A0AAJ0ALW8_9PEZI|nr:uncharacterized protein BDP55DRAFT_631472 [Colletotrichum godetiae]KAK1676309.1 hypothetical protein BDP55DRAFT_631472 [Colletotrichum godetiae]